MSADTTAPDPAPVVPPPAGELTPTTPVSWPRWFAGFDLALGVMAVVLAFLTASFVARNSDIWRHLATGRLTVQGNYPLGKDPFTFTAADRAWVNPSWLTEVAFYALYSMDTSGAVLVAVKAMMFAGAFGLLLLLRKPTAPLWPWAVALTLGAIAASAQAQLRPVVVGLLMQAVVLVVLFRGNWATGHKWRMPLILGGVTAAWANLDSFAFLAPLTVALLLVGELVHTRFLATTADPDDPFPPVPPMPALGKALLASLVGLLLNPTFLAAAVTQPGEAVAQLIPTELDLAGTAVLQQDDDFVRGTYSALNREYTKSQLLGDNPPGYAALMLTALAAVLSAVGYKAGRASHLLLWLGLAALAALLHHRYLPFLAVVSVPYVAAHLNGLGRLLGRLPLTPQAARLLVFGSGGGRVLSAVALVVLGLVAFPGRLQIHIEERTHARWVAWGMEADEGMTRAGELIQGWRTEQPNRLGGVRGVCGSPEFGDYLCWSAPAERSFVTTRFRLHRAELDDLVRFRAAVHGKKDADPAAIDEVMRKYDAGFVCVGLHWLQLKPEAVYAVRGRFERRPDEFAQESLNESLWHLDGRMAVLGRADTLEGKELCRQMAWDVTRQAFGPARRAADPPADGGDSAAKLDPGVPPADGWEFEYFARPATRPVALDDARLFGDYAMTRQANITALSQRRMAVWRGLFPFRAWAAAGGPAAVAAVLRGPPPVMLGDHDLALPVVTHRAARTAVALKPDEPDGYLTYGFIVSLGQTPEAAISDATQLLTGSGGGRDEIRQQAITAFTRALARMPEVAEGVPQRNPQQALAVRTALVQFHLVADGEINLDVARRLVGEMAKIAAAGGQMDPGQVSVERLWDGWFSILARMATARARPTDPRPTAEQLLGQFQAAGVIQKDDHPGQWKETDTPAARREFVVTRLVRLEASMKEVERQTNDGVEQMTAKMAAGPPGPRAQEFARNGLPRRGIELILEAGDKAKGQTVGRQDLLILVGLLQRVGRLEEAAFHRRNLEADLEKTPDPSGQFAGLRLGRQTLEFQEAYLAGDYRRADTLIEQIWKNQSLAPLSDVQKKMAVASPLALPAAAGWAPTFPVVEDSVALRTRLQLEAVYWCRRGLFALYDGDVARAKQMFDAAAEPQGVKLADLGVSRDLAILTDFLPRYRALLDKYATDRK